MAAGIDTSTKTSSALACLVASGCTFVFRYYCAAASAKRLTRAEAAEISAHGMQVAAVWESGYPTSAAYFSRESGKRDGLLAYKYAADTIGQPAGSAIYFAVDFDANKTEREGVIADYFAGIRESFEAEGGEVPAYIVGVYGSGATCRSLLDAGAVKKTWLAQSTGWAGFASFDAWDVKQQAQTTRCGIYVDPDEARGDFGGFTIAAAVETGRADLTVSPPAPNAGVE